jgi:hypothetical protein
MRVEIIQDLETCLADPDAKTPWLTGRGTHWELTQDYVLTITTPPASPKRYVVPAGYIFDGASIPAALWWMFPATYAPAWRAAAFHDRAYSHWYEHMSKAFADEAFRQIMLREGAPRWVASAFHWAVSTFGKGGW